MATSHVGSLVVRNTFLEICEESPRRQRVSTDSAVWCDFSARFRRPCSSSVDITDSVPETDADDTYSTESTTGSFASARNDSGSESDTSLSSPCNMEALNCQQADRFRAVQAASGASRSVGDQQGVSPFIVWWQHFGMMASTAQSTTQHPVSSSSCDPAAATARTATTGRAALTVTNRHQRPASGAHGDDRTTVMLRNLPNNYTAKMVLEMLDKEGFAGLYNLFYLPMDLTTNACKGYAFVNLTHPQHVDAFWKVFNGYSDWIIPTRKLCRVTWSDDQGLAAFQSRYRDSSLMHPSVADDFKPMMFDRGRRVAFTAPTRPLQPPRIRGVGK